MKRIDLVDLGAFIAMSGFGVVMYSIAWALLTRPPL